MHDNLKVKQQSLQELMIADSCKPTLIDEFIIFFLKYLFLIWYIEIINNKIKEKHRRGNDAN